MLPAYYTPHEFIINLHKVICKNAEKGSAVPDIDAVGVGAGFLGADAAS